MAKFLISAKRAVHRINPKRLAFAVLLTPVPPTLATVDEGMNDLGLWAIVSFFVVVIAIMWLYRRLKRA